jgi:acetyl-CoA carboxylase biotin carboxyl carrier protein
MATLDPELVRHALGVARQHGFAEVELGIGEESFTAKLDCMPPKSSPQKQAAGQIAMEPELQTIAATLVGYYRPTKTPLQVGAVVKKGDIVAVIAALGIANDVESKVSGEVVEVLVEPNQPVEYGQAIAKVKI